MANNLNIVLPFPDSFLNLQGENKNNDMPTQTIRLSSNVMSMLHDRAECQQLSVDDYANHLLYIMLTQASHGVDAAPHLETKTAATRRSGARVPARETLGKPDKSLEQSMAYLKTLCVKGPTPVPADVSRQACIDRLCGILQDDGVPYAVTRDEIMEERYGKL